MARRDTILSQEIIVAQISHHVLEAWTNLPASASGCIPSYYDVLSILLSFFKPFNPNPNPNVVDGEDNILPRVHLLIRHTSSPVWVASRIGTSGGGSCSNEGSKGLRWTRVKIGPLSISQNHPLLACIRKWPTAFPMQGCLHPVSWIADPFSEPAQVYANPLEVLKCCMDLARPIMRHTMSTQQDYHQGALKPPNFLAQYLLDAAQLRILVSCTQLTEGANGPNVPDYFPQPSSTITMKDVAVANCGGVNLPCFHLSSDQQHPHNSNCPVCGIKTLGPLLHVLQEGPRRSSL